MLLQNRGRYTAAPGVAELEERDGTALESHVVMAGTRVAAALEILSVRPPGEIAIPVPGAAEAGELTDLLLRVDPFQDQDTVQTAEEGTTNEEYAKGTADMARVSPAETGYRRESQVSETEAEIVEDEPVGEFRGKSLSKMYQVADDLWGDSELGSQTHALDGASADTAIKQAASPEPTGTSEVSWLQMSQREPDEAAQEDELQQLLDRRWTAWGPFCPVSLKEGKLVEGKKEFAVDFSGRLFLLADEEKRALFIKDPKRYTDAPPSIPPTASVYIFGPSFAGASKQARLLSRAYGFITIDVARELVKGHKRAEEETQRLKEEEEGRIAEQHRQEVLHKQLKREEEERKIMAAEDDAQRFSFTSSGAEDVAEPLYVSGFGEETDGFKTRSHRNESQQSSTAPCGSESTKLVNGKSPKVSNEEATKKEPPEGKSKAEGNISPKHSVFITSPGEEKTLHEGKALGRQGVTQTAYDSLQSIKLNISLEKCGEPRFSTHSFHLVWGGRSRHDSQAHRSRSRSGGKFAPRGRN